MLTIRLRYHTIAVLVLIALSMGCNQGGTPAEEKTASPPETVESQEPARLSIDPEGTEISFVIVSNSAGAVTARFPKGASGWIRPGDAAEGQFAIQLDTMKSTTADGLENPVRDSNVVEAFFGVRPSALFPEPVDKAWEAIGDRLTRNVAKAVFEVKAVSGISDLADRATGPGSITGNLVLWKTISTEVTFSFNATRSGNAYHLHGTAPTVINLEDILGPELRKLAFDTMLAAACAHQPGIQNEVAINLHRVVLRQDP